MATEVPAHVEVLWLRELLEKVAQDLEFLAMDPALAGGPAKRLRRRAMRIRQRLHDGVPEDWRPRVVTTPAPVFDNDADRGRSPVPFPGV